MNTRYHARSALSAFILSLLLALPAFALDLGDAKARGLVGETAAGYLGAVKPSAEVNTLVKDINAQRKAGLSLSW